MTSPYLLRDLERDESLRLIAYPDPISGGVPWTIGYGHTGREVYPGLIWTSAQCQAALAADIAAAKNGLYTSIPWYLDLEDVRQDCLVNMAFNLGVHGLLNFTTFLSLMKAGKYAEAALDLRGTPWFKEVGDRAKRIVAQITTGQHQE